MIAQYSSPICKTVFEIAGFYCGIRNDHSQGDVRIDGDVFENTGNPEVFLVLVYNDFSDSLSPVAEIFFSLILCQNCSVWLSQGGTFIAGKPVKIEHFKKLRFGKKQVFFVKLFYGLSTISTYSYLLLR